MQNAKDTFYITLRNRLAALAPDRVMTLRALQRPAICVEDAEAPTGELIEDCFVLRWTSEQLVATSCGTLMSLGCELMYASSGSQTNAGLDRGRDLAAMDALLMNILQPYYAVKMNYTVTLEAAMQTNVFWSEPVFGAQKTVEDQVSRQVTTFVFAYQEPGEL